MIPKRQPIALNRKTRRAEGIKLIKIKRGKPPSGPSSLIEALKRVITENDSAVSMTEGLMMAEKGWLFHRDGQFMYAVTSNKTRVTLHVMPMSRNDTIRRAYQKLIANGDFGKGCIRFKLNDNVDLGVIARLICDCAKVE
jgi:hypothetical protein